MQCLKNFTNDEIQEYLDGALAEDRAAAFAAHLDACDRCRNALEGLMMVDAALAELSPDDMPANLHARVMASLRSAPAPATWPRLAAAAAVVLVASGIFGLLVGAGEPGDVVAYVSETAATVMGADFPDTVTPQAVETSLQNLTASLGDDVSEAALGNFALAQALPLDGTLLACLAGLALSLAAGLNFVAFRKSKANLALFEGDRE
jgi:hypothetical protein